MPPTRGLALDLGAGRRGRLPLEVDADGERPDAGRVAAALDLGDLAVGPRLEVPVHRLQEVLAVVAQVEPQQVVAEQPVEQLRASEDDVAEGPQPAIGQAVVIAFLLLLWFASRAKCCIGLAGGSGGVSQPGRRT